MSKLKIGLGIAAGIGTVAGLAYAMDERQADPDVQPAKRSVIRSVRDEAVDSVDAEAAVSDTENDSIPTASGQPIVEPTEVIIDGDVVVVTMHPIPEARAPVSKLGRRVLYEVGAAVVNVAFTAGAQALMMAAMVRFGHASTGTRIRDLHGVARRAAAEAQFGLGTRADGRFGRSGGRLVMDMVSETTGWIARDLYWLFAVRDDDREHGAV